MKQQENGNENISNDNFMKTIYNKVLDLKLILKQNQQKEMGFTSCSFNNVFNKTSVNNSQRLKNQRRVQSTQQFTKTQSINRIQINDQSKINRQQQIIIQRMQHLSGSKKNMTKTFSSLYNLHFNKTQKQSINNYVQGSNHSSSPTQNQSSNKFSLTAPNFNQINTNEKNISSNKWIILKQAKTKNSPKEQKVQSKTQLSSTLLKDRKQNKMARILGFLDKNGDHCQKQRKQQQKLKEVKEVTTNREKTRSEIRSSLNSRMNQQNGNEIVKGQQAQQVDIDYHCEFKPMGSAKTPTRQSASSHKKMVKTYYQLLQTLSKEKPCQGKQISLHSNELSKKTTVEKRTYLSKGTRIRDILYKKLSIKSGSMGEELVYVKEYDQWVPAGFAERSKQELQNYLLILMGGKKRVRTQRKLTLQEAEIIYF